METLKSGIPEVLTVKDAAAYLRLSEMTVLRLAGQGILRGAKVGRQWRFPREGVVNLLNDTHIIQAEKENGGGR